VYRYLQRYNAAVKRPPQNENTPATRAGVWLTVTPRAIKPTSATEGAYFTIGLIPTSYPYTTPILHAMVPTTMHIIGDIGMGYI
jgi:hypothetical protein